MKEKRSRPSTNLCSQRIKERREELGFNREELSNKLQLMGVNLDRHQLYKIETNKRTLLDIELNAISKILKTSPNELLKFE